MVMVRLGLIAFVEKCCAIQAGEPGVDNPGRLAGCMHVDAFYCRGAVHEGCGDVHACGSMKRIVNINWDLEGVWCHPQAGGVVIYKAPGTLLRVCTHSQL